MKQPVGCQVSRRDFVKLGALTGGSVAFLGATAGFPALVKAQTTTTDARAAYPLTDPANQIYTVCLQCNTGCGIKVKLLDGVAAKIDGNPFSTSDRNRTTVASRLPRYSARYSPAPMPTGRPMTHAIPTSTSVPTIALAMPPPVSPGGLGMLVKNDSCIDERPLCLS